MQEFLKSIYRFCCRLILRKDKVSLGKFVRFNNLTHWGGYNKVGRHSVVSNSTIGRYSFMGSDCLLSNTEIGKFCSIGNNVQVVPETHPSRGFRSTHPAFYSTRRQCGITFVKENLFDERLTVNGRYCIIGNDVWIGNDVRIIGGVTIGTGAIIGLGAVVTKDVPPYAIVGGVPAKIIRYRFEPDKIQELLDSKWWNNSEFNN